MAKNVKPYALMSREEERNALRAQSEKIRKNPEIGVKIAQKAGILDKNGELTLYYKQNV